MLVGADLTTSRRVSTALSAAGAVGGVVEVLGFLVPLWAAASLGASSTLVGVVVGVELVVSFLARAAAGRLADTRARNRVAALGAATLALGAAGYALSPDVPTAIVSAAVAGLGASLFRVPVRAMVAEGSADEPAVFARLTSSEATGTWVGYVVGLSALGLVGSRGVFALGAAAALACCAALLRLDHRRTVTERDRVASRVLRRRLLPLLVLVAVVALVEGAVGLAVLLKLQGQGLGVDAIALTFLPGLVVWSLLPVPGRRLAARLGAPRTLALATAASTVASAALFLVDQPLAIGIAWVLACSAWALVEPVELELVTGSADGRVGEALGTYEAAALLGGAIGAVAGGAALALEPRVVTVAVVLVVGACAAAMAPRAVRALNAAASSGPHGPRDDD